MFGFPFQTCTGAGGVGTVGVGIGASNATDAGGVGTVGVGIGASNATNAGGVGTVGVGIGASNARKAGGVGTVGVGIGASNARRAKGTRDLKAALHFFVAADGGKAWKRRESECTGAAETDVPNRPNASIITDIVSLISY